MSEPAPEAMPAEVVAVAVVVDPTGRRVLQVPDEGDWSLPTVSLPRDFWFPDVALFLESLAERHRVDAIVLDCLEREQRKRPAQNVTYLMELRRGTEAPPQSRWAPLTMAEAANALVRPTGHPATPAWTKPGWYAEAVTWAQDRLASAERPMTGPPDQIRTWGLSCVLRCPTATGNVYFKATAHQSTILPRSTASTRPLLFAHEPRVLDRLSRHRLGDIPRPMAIDENRVWMLLPDLGPPLASVPDLPTWTTALRDHARLQRSFTGSTDQLLDAGCVDRRLAVLDQQIDDLFGTNVVTGLLSDDDRRRLALRRGDVHAAIAELARIDIPETLLHGDLHPRNIAVTDGRAVAFDWTDAALAHPFLDLTTFFEDRSPITGDPILARQLKAAYLAEWGEYASADDLQTALGLAEELAPVHQAISYLHMADYLSGPSRAAMTRGGAYWLHAMLAQSPG